MDLEIIPLRVEFRVFAKIHICIWKCWTKTLFDKLLWAFQLKTIKINIFNYKDAEPDNSPPAFSDYELEVSIALIFLQTIIIYLLVDTVAFVLYCGCCCHISYFPIMCTLYPIK